ncbi:MAG TPA: pyridoxine 5'-phosphate synthase [Opitutales bacterium]|nr:pyridoxine 5'-phosphate synthase [Opitutales bacterium]
MASHIFLGVNIDHCATVREARYRENPQTCGQFIEPDPVTFALFAEQAGADGITVHLRQDRRHMQDRDIYRLRESIATRLNFEMACTAEMVAFASEILPETVCLVPETSDEVTTEGGLDVAGQFDRVRGVVETMHEKGIQVSLFIDPEPQQIEAAAKLKAEFVELHTGTYAKNYYTDSRQKEFEKLRKSSELAHQSGLIVNAGHGINYINIAEIRRLPWLHELNIGHSIISRALFTGVKEAVREMKARMHGA